MTDETFADYGVQDQICAALAGAGITSPFPIQAMTLPVALSGHDIIGQAKTGTGKTLGFGIPLVQRVVGPGEAGWDELALPGAPQALVVVPTRELALQVAGDLTLAAKRRSVRVATIFGGRAYEPQLETLRTGVEVVVGTPGRLVDLSGSGSLNLAHTRIVVLDEADEMLDLGFLPDVEKLLKRTPDGRQTMLFSATMPSAVVALGRQYMHHPTHIRASDPEDSGATVTAITQWAYRCHAMDKIEVLARLLQAEARGLTMVFTRTRRSASSISDDLTDRGFAAAAIHGDLGQGAREQALRAFRNGKVDVLVATEVAARGIDVEDVTHVVNYECPDDSRAYLHRIGRTGRAGATGTAVTFVDWADMVRWSVIDRELDLGLGEPEETYSTSANLYAELAIPAGISGRLPRASRTRAGLSAETREEVEGPSRAGATKGRSRHAGGARDDRPRDDRPRDDRPREGGARAGGSRDAQPRDAQPRDTAPARRDTPGTDGDTGTGGRSRSRSRTRRPSGDGGDTAAPVVRAAAEPGAGGASQARRRRRRRPGGLGVDQVSDTSPN